MNARILHVVGDSKFGGAALCILRLAQDSISRGYFVAILTTDSRFQKAAQECGVPVVASEDIRRSINPIRDISSVIRLAWFLRKNSFDIVHTHTSKGGFIGRIAAWLAGVPVILHTAHGFAFHEKSPRLQILMCSILERIASWAGDKVITVSNFHRKWGIACGVATPRKIYAIPNGIPDPKAFDTRQRPSLRADFGVREDQDVVVGIGRLTAQKGFADLVRAVSFLSPERRERLVVLIAGDGPDLKPLRRSATQLGIGHCLHFLGFRANLVGLLAIADVVVLPTWREGLSIALLEAMAQGKAILTTSIGSNREATDDGAGAWLVPPRSPHEMAIALEGMLASSGLREHLGRNARKIYSCRYTTKSMLSSYQQVYEDLLVAARSPSISSVKDQPGLRQGGIS